MSEAILNFDDPKVRARVANRIREMRGRYRFNVVKYRPRRSDRQNRYYWPCFVHEFGELLRSAGNEMTDEQAHEILKHKFLRREAIDETTGEVMTYTESTTRLDTSEFNTYLDQCAAWLAELGVIVPDAAEYREKDDK